MPLRSLLPDHKKREQRDSMFIIQVFGRMNVEVQKLTVPKITVFNSCSLPAKDSIFADHEWRHELILFIKGAYSETFNFLLINGSPRYLMGR